MVVTIATINARINVLTLFIGSSPIRLSYGNVSRSVRFPGARALLHPQHIYQSLLAPGFNVPPFLPHIQSLRTTLSKDRGGSYACTWQTLRFLGAPTDSYYWRRAWGKTDMPLRHAPSVAMTPRFGFSSMERNASCTKERVFAGQGPS